MAKQDIKLKERRQKALKYPVDLDHFYALLLEGKAFGEVASELYVPTDVLIFHVPLLRKKHNLVELPDCDNINDVVTDDGLFYLDIKKLFQLYRVGLDVKIISGMLHIPNWVIHAVLDL